MKINRNLHERIANKIEIDPLEYNGIKLANKVIACENEYLRAELEAARAELAQARFDVENGTRMITQITKIADADALDFMKRISKLAAELAAMRESSPYVELAQARAKIALLSERERWIPCSERMPEPGQAVLMWIQPNTYVPGNAKEGAYMPMINLHWPWRSTWDMATYNPEDVTHWRPLPEPPAANG